MTPDISGGTASGTPLGFMPNINKLFPRLSIRLKLAIAFAVIALVPLAITSVIGLRATADQLQEAATAAVERDLLLAEAQTARALQDFERHVKVIADNVLRPLLEGADAEEWAAAERIVTTSMESARALIRIKLLGVDGAALLVGEGSGSRALPRGDTEAGSFYYAWRARAERDSGSIFIPVELRGEGAVAVPAIAVLLPIRDGKGALIGAVVGEGLASSLFAGIELESSTNQGTTGLVDADGLFLYHSERKRDWGTLLAARHEVNLRSDFPAPIADRILSGGAGTVMVEGRVVSYRPLWPEFSGRPLTLYREIALSTMGAPLRRFLGGASLAGVLVIAIVLGLATLAASQLTRPIYRLREGAIRLAQGAPGEAIQVETNDELEDLARDFTTMADALSRHRHKLEELVVERTRALQATDAELRDILKHSADAIVGLDTRGRVRVWNDGAERLFGYSATEASGRNLVDLIGPKGTGADGEIAYLRRELDRSGAVVDFRTERTDKDGTALPVALTHTLVADREGRRLGSSLIIRDASAEEQVREQMRQSERLAAVNVMAASLAHELNNPLAIISNRLECMQVDAREKWDDARLERDLEVLHEHVDRLGAVTKDLLRFARAGSDEPGAVQLDRVAERIVTLLERTFVTQRITLQLEPPPNDLPAIVAGEKAIETVLVNLLLNAAEATPAGGSITVALRYDAQRDAVHMDVSDTGRGIPIELRDRVFDPLFTTKGERGGTGLGLTVCQSIIERHRGSIRVEGVEGGGTRFRVTLPREPLRHSR